MCFRLLSGGGLSSDLILDVLSCWGEFGGLCGWLIWGDVEGLYAWSKFGGLYDWLTWGEFGEVYIRSTWGEFGGLYIWSTWSEFGELYGWLPGCADSCCSIMASSRSKLDNSVSFLSPAVMGRKVVSLD